MATSGPVGVGIIGCGSISDDYLRALTTYEHLRVKACADLDLERARARAERWGVPHVCTPEELLADPEIELVGNFTVPLAHAEVGLAAIRSGKSVYNEKPFAHTRELGRQLLREAQEHGVRIGGAPDTWLGQPPQNVRRLLDDGGLGEPVGATMITFRGGAEGWHPNPAFFYQRGAGPVLDLAPYTLAGLVALLGPIARVIGSARTTHAQRLIASEPLTGQLIDVEVPTHFAGVVELERGPLATVSISWDVVASEIASLYELYGTEGTVRMPDPDDVEGIARVGTPDETWSDLPLTHGAPDRIFGIGMAEMAAAMRSGRPHLASGELAYHVLDAMLAIEEAVESGRRVEVESTCERPDVLPSDWLTRHLDAAPA